MSIKLQVGIRPENVEVLGILRCDWTTVEAITGIPVTPVVGFVGDVSQKTLNINRSEVDQWFRCVCEIKLSYKSYILLHCFYSLSLSHIHITPPHTVYH